MSSHAQLPLDVLYEVEGWLCVDDEPGSEYLAESRLSERFDQFENEQPALAAYVGENLSRTGDDLVVALGYFLAIITWMAFDRAFEGRLSEIDGVSVTGVVESFELDEELRRADPAEILETDDVVALEQPELVQFINDHIETALEAHAGVIDVDAVNKVYRLLLQQVLALSYAVGHPDGESYDADALSETRDIYA